MKKNSPIDPIEDWMLNQLQKTKLNHPKANQGFVTLKGSKDHEQKLRAYIHMALNIIIQRFSTNTLGKDLGYTKLTELSAAIGKSISNNMGLDISVYKQIHLGNAFLGGFHMEGNGFIDIYRDEAYSEYSETAPYVVAANLRFRELADLPDELDDEIIVSSTTTPIPPVSAMIQANNRPIIKDYKEEHLVDLAHAIQNLESENEEVRNRALWLSSFNKLQEQAWMINEEVYDIVESSKGNLMKPVGVMPSVGSSENVRKAMEDLKKKQTKTTTNNYNRAVAEWAAKLSVISAISKNTEIGIILAKAQKLKEMGTFYQYAELDYRGRVYTYEPLMNFQGPDLARGLFLFANGEPLGSSGLSQLYIHAANCYNESFHKDSIPSYFSYDYKSLLNSQGLEDISLDKMTFDDKISWVSNNMEFILSSCESLRDCEKPVSFLAACIEIRNAEAHENPEEYVCHLPIPIDGSCNGYQHSAAIARDEKTGELVSLTDQDVQADLYTVAAQELMKRMPQFFSSRPDMKMKHIRKGIAKRAVMTRAYSAGKEKIADSMFKDCYAEGYTTDFNISMSDCTELADNIYELIKDVCPGATKTMKFLQDLAAFQMGTWGYYDVNGKKISKAKRKRLHKQKQALQKIPHWEITEDQLKELEDVSAELNSHEKKCTRGNGTTSMHWVTPTGFIVRYEAFIHRESKFKSIIPGFAGGAKASPGRITFVLQVETDFPDIRAYQAGISPNFIHSLDASHMAIVVAHWGGAFGAIHDSFSSHACDIKDLSELTREAFVLMYSDDNPYERIASMILHGDATLDIAYPTTGNLTIEDVLTSKYFFC